MSEECWASLVTRVQVGEAAIVVRDGVVRAKLVGFWRLHSLHNQELLTLVFIGLQPKMAHKRDAVGRNGSSQRPFGVVVMKTS
jgi:hypothetical protein